ncbi:MAG: deoxycytidylate deaminase [Candidatus Hodarchaeales archaeon]|jgi:dCMP deaminase
MIDVPPTENNHNKRPTWDQFFSQIAKLVSKRSTCRRRNIGSVLVKNRQILATGYNGAARGMPHCLDIGCLRDERNIPSGTQLEVCRAVHGEINAIIQCASHGVGTDGSELYVTGHPCKICSRIIINAGVKRVVICGEYTDKDGVKILEEAGITVDCIVIS